MTKSYVIVINSLIGGGAERIACILANHLSEKGKVHIFVLDGRTETQYHLHNSIKVNTLFAGYVSFSALRIALIPLLAFELWFRRDILIKPDGCISFLVRANLVNIVSSLFSKQALISERTSLHELYKGVKFSNFVMRKLIAFLYPRAKSCIAISHGVKRDLVDVGVDPDRIHVVYNPVEGFESGPIRSAPGTTIRLVTAGRLIESKDYPTLVKALGSVRHSGLNAELYIFGIGPMQDEIIKAARNCGVDGHVYLRGFCADIKREFENSDIFVFSSRREGFGNVLIEALQAGLPVASTDCPYGPREILAPETLDFDDQGLVVRSNHIAERDFEVGQFGILARIGDPEGLARGICWLAEDPDRYKLYACRGKLRAKQFDLEKIASDYEILMSSAASERQ